MILFTNDRDALNLVHHYSVAPPLVLLAHAPVRHTPELVAEGLGLAVGVELVEHEEHYGVAACAQGGVHILAGVTGG